MALTIAGAGLPVMAQTTYIFTQAPEVIYEAGPLEIVTTSNEIGRILDKSRPVEPNSIPRPKFAIRSKDNKFIMSIGGKINPIIGYDLGNDLYNAPGGGVSFTTAIYPYRHRRDKRARFSCNPLSAYLDFTVVGFAGTDNQVTGYIKLATTNHDSKGYF